MRSRSDDGLTAIDQCRNLDAVVTRDGATGKLGITLVNLHGEDAISCRVRGLGAGGLREATLRTLNGAAVDSYNDVDQPDAVSISESSLSISATRGLCC